MPSDYDHRTQSVLEAFYVLDTSGSRRLCLNKGVSALKGPLLSLHLLPVSAGKVAYQCVSQNQIIRSGPRGVLLLWETGHTTSHKHCS